MVISGNAGLLQVGCGEKRTHALVDSLKASEIHAAMARQSCVR